MWLDENDVQNSNKPAQPVGELSVGAGGGIAQPGSKTGTTSNPSTNTPVQSNQPKQDFATVQDYLGANKPQGEDLGQKFTSSLDTSANQEKSTIGQSAQQAQNDITAGTTNYDANLVNSAVSNPTDVANNSDQLGSFLKQWNASYTGPSSFETATSYTPAAAAANEASQKQAEVGTAGGQQQLIQDQFGVYGQGNKGLDQAILQNSSFYPKVQDEANNFKSVQDYLGDNSTNLSNLAQTAQAQTDATKQQTQNAFTGSLANFKGGLDTRTATARQDANDAIAAEQKALASGDPAQINATLSKISPDPAVNKSISDYLSSLDKNYGMIPKIDPSYFGNPNVDITNGNVANSNDYAKAAALQKLTGVDYSGVLNPADQSKAGTANSLSGLQPGGIASYLKSGLDTQDTSALNTAPKLNRDAINSGDPSAPTKAINQVQSIIDAGKRQGIDPAQNTALKSVKDDALNAIYAFVHNKDSVTTKPALKTYADAAVAALMGEGKSQSEAQQFINKWQKELSSQVGATNVTPIYSL